MKAAPGRELRSFQIGDTSMFCPTLAELPSPPAGKTGWPWTEESRRLDTAAKRQPWPRISIVTPSFNQGQFIEETIRSILLQGYSDLEYLVLDGGSTDDSVEIIKKYSPWISYCVSEPDGGQSEAINRGLKQASGEFATWINSDDMLCKNALNGHACCVGFKTDTVYVGDCVYIDQFGTAMSVHRGRVHSLEDLVSVGDVWRAEDYRGHIDQPAVLFPRALALCVGGLNTDNHFTMDYELWGDFFLAGARFQYSEISFGIFREHQGQKTGDVVRQTQSLLQTAAALVNRADRFSEQAKKETLTNLNAYNLAFQDAYWKGTGRLAKIGLPPFVVTPIRKLRSIIQRAMKVLVSQEAE